eukprot:1665-Heterococcus_DN1.PRE.2
MVALCTTQAADEARRKSVERNQELTTELQRFLQLYEDRQAEDAADVKSTATALLLAKHCAACSNGLLIMLYTVPCAYNILQREQQQQKQRVQQRYSTWLSCRQVLLRNVVLSALRYAATMATTTVHTSLGSHPVAVTALLLFENAMFICCCCTTVTPATQAAVCSRVRSCKLHADAQAYTYFQASLTETNARFNTYKETMATLNKIAEASGKRAAALAQLESEKAADESELAALLLKRTRLEAVCSALRAQLESSSGINSSVVSSGGAAAEP